MQKKKRGMLVLALGLVLVFLVSINNSCFSEGVDIWDNDTLGWTTTFANGDPIDVGTGSSANTPQIAVASNGIVYIVFYQHSGSYQRLYLSRYDGTDVRIWNNTSGWITTFADGDPIDAATGSSVYSPQMAIDSNGVVYIVYEQSGGGVQSIYLTKYDGTDVKIWDNGLSVWTDTFTDGDPIDTAKGYGACSPQIAIDSTGKVYVTYYQSDGSYNRIYLSRYDGTDVKIWDNGLSVWTDTFTDGDPIDKGINSSAYDPQLAIDSSGRVYVTYYQSDGSYDHIYLSRYDGTDVKIWDNGLSVWTDTFTDGDPIDKGINSSAYDPQLAIDSSDRVYVTYRQSISIYHIYLSRYDGEDVKIWDNGNSEWTDTFAEGDSIDKGTIYSAYNPQLAIDFSDRVYVTYRQSDGSFIRIYLSRYDGTDAKIWDSETSSWTDTFADGDPIDPGTQNCGNPQLAVDLNGNVYVTYAHVLPTSTYLNRYNGTDVRIWDNDISDWTTTFADGDSIDVGNGDSFSAQIAADLSGVVYVTYQYYEQVQEMQKLFDADFSYSRILLNRYVPEVSSASSDNKEDKSSCFLESILGIARANDKDDKIIVLRRFRDEKLSTNPIGKFFVTAYYRISPMMVGLAKQCPVLNSATREVLSPVIWLCEKTMGQ